MIALVLLAQLAATPAATPTLAPVVAASEGQTRTLADVARERKLGKKGVQGGTLSVAGAPLTGLALAPAGSSATTAAEARQERAIRDAAWVAKNIHWNEQIRENARNEWNAAAEKCRQTPGCAPVYRDPDVLPTGKEAARALQKKLGPDVDTPGR